MTHRAVLCRAIACAATLLLSAAAQAQLFRAYLASDGSDGNTCTLASPCRLLPKALAVVADGGEIWMLDSANYNTAPVVIAKSVTILAVPGALGSVVATGGNAIDVFAAGVKLALRNLMIVPLPNAGAAGGINMSAGGELTIENCLIANLPQSAVVVTASRVRITDTTIRDSGNIGLYLVSGARATVTRSTISGHTGYGVFGFGTAAGTTTIADIADSTVDGNGIGVFAWSINASAVLKISVHDSRIVQNTFYGVGVESDAGATVTFSAGDNIISNSGTGIRAVSAGGKVWASGNTVTGNGTGIFNSGAVVESAGNNALRNNGADTTGSVAVIATK